MSRFLPRQRHPQNARREIRHHHEDAQLHPVSHDSRIVLALDGSSIPSYAQDGHQRFVNLGSAWIHGADQLLDSKGWDRGIDQDSGLRMESVRE